jgi:hypothetical protein
MSLFFSGLHSRTAATTGKVLILGGSIVPLIDAQDQEGAFHPRLVKLEVRSAQVIDTEAVYATSRQSGRRTFPSSVLHLLSQQGCPSWET